MANHIMQKSNAEIVHDIGRLVKKGIHETFSKILQLDHITNEYIQKAEYVKKNEIHNIF